MPRFALLSHDWPHPHCDLLLERGDTAWTWRLPADCTEFLPALAEAMPAERIANHRLHYLTWSGPVSGDRGVVQQLDRGDWSLKHEADGELLFSATGDILRGQFRLRCAAPETLGNPAWLLERAEQQGATASE